MSFERAFAATMQHEGGYVNNPQDPGGETYMGIARNHHPKWAGWKIIDDCLKHGEPLSLADGLADAVREFYKDNFWTPLQCRLIDPVSEEVAAELFESSVNCGPKNGVKFLQRALNALNSRGKLWPDLVVDGAIGPKTMHAVLTCLTRRPASILVKCQNGEQYSYYKSWSKHRDFPGVFERT